MNKIKYEKPVVMDLGIGEGMGDCSNGTLVISPRCTSGATPNPNSSCRKGSAASLGCSSGSVPLSCSDGAVAALAPR